MDIVRLSLSEEPGVHRAELLTNFLWDLVLVISLTLKLVAELLLLDGESDGSMSPLLEFVDEGTKPSISHTPSHYVNPT